MNATSISPPDFFEENDIQSDSDTNPDDVPEYYQPISAVDDEDSDQANSDEEHHHGYHYASDSHNLDNGYCTHEAENGISSLHLNDDGEGKSSDEEEEEERMIEASDSAILRAFREDESRRNAPLTQENAMRIMEAMRGISFGGLAPDWVGRVPEDQWIHQLRRLRQPAPNPSASVQNQRKG